MQCDTFQPDKMAASALPPFRKLLLFSEFLLHQSSIFLVSTTGLFLYCFYFIF